MKRGRGGGCLTGEGVRTRVRAKPRGGGQVRRVGTYCLGALPISSLFRAALFVVSIATEEEK